MVAPDNVILGIKKIWEDRDKEDKIQGKNMYKLFSDLRQDLMGNTGLKENDYFLIHF